MAFYDNSLLLSNAQSLAGNTGTTNSTSIYDVTGAGVGTAPSMIWGTSANLAADIGVGKQVYAFFTVSTAFVSAATTLTVKVAAAPPAASGNTEGTYTLLYTSAAFTGTQLTKGAMLVVPIPPFALIAAAETLPRFYKFQYTIASATYSAGAITGGILLDVPTGMVSTLYPNNYASGL